MMLLSCKSHLPELKPLLRGWTLWRAACPKLIALLRLWDALWELPDFLWSMVGAEVWAGKPARHREAEGNPLGLQLP